MLKDKIRIFPLQRKIDHRGYLEEVFRADMLPAQNQEFGQCFLTTARPGVVKGNHWHKNKYELFYLVKGEAVLYFKDLQTEETCEIAMSDQNPVVIQIPPLLLHAIKNTGTENFYLFIYTDKLSMELDLDDKDTIWENWL